MVAAAPLPAGADDGRGSTPCKVGSETVKPGDVLLFDRVRQRLDSRKEVFIDQKADKGHAMVMLFLGTAPLFARKVDPQGFDRLRSLGWMPQNEAQELARKVLCYSRHISGCAGEGTDCDCGLDELRKAVG